ncbi:MAG: hypothetical protein ACXQTY_02340 [Candidatus Methanogasteraceae archaeon]|uniref:Uncharacterized protein n=1 Tax=Candidatus Methanogaster sp. ANME-2c ERB4 TaxID=2759911 RepID=A0A7G9Y6R8_9EURY|nr:hypothetical protein CIGHHIFM_00005 [Methanosarcinales archaeon ANME-2c ERB4]QNO43906.1 hypothetical protein NANOEKIO_00005 [Methanosarcinales archaeon ANME-2c ERB4]QNO44459.1 hypothetical protein ELEJOALA_00005 [Methanosarcinales archaeon ANME-2c ERB4]QNO45191.1 hypothetical protein KDMJNAGO_00005 [Methanosarcinales archaeon ANME-2c ERB4]
MATKEHAYDVTDALIWPGHCSSHHVGTRQGDRMDFLTGMGGYDPNIRSDCNGCGD